MVPGDSHIEVIVGATDSTNPQVSCDSQVDIPVETADRVQIRKYPHQLELLYPVEHSFYESCRSKLDWASRLGGATVAAKVAKDGKGANDAHDKG
jgi:NAD+ kinase